MTIYLKGMSDGEVSNLMDDLDTLGLVRAVALSPYPPDWDASGPNSCPKDAVLPWPDTEWIKRADARASCPP